jgi:hypothetical protein
MRCRNVDSLGRWLPLTTTSSPKLTLLAEATSNGWVVVHLLLQLQPHDYAQSNTHV